MELRQKESYMGIPVIIKKHYLNQGMIFVSRNECIITTVLGSCISICLWDPASGIGGMNHYMLPLWNGDSLPSPRYGNIAITKLIDKMISAGCAKKNLKAKVFGGAEILYMPKSMELSIGMQNIMLADDLLSREGIPVISIDVGGNCGRKIEFNTKEGIVKLKRLNNYQPLMKS